ncbi:ankyrin repeat-containing domain protein [Mycena vulgaris]|nr:ankyrin repeat-containing domain protein [Mycena vulgaris]
MPDRHSLKKLWTTIRQKSGVAVPSIPVDPSGTGPQRQPPWANDVVPAKSTGTAASAIDTLSLALDLVQQVANIVQKAPFIAPAAALMSEILQAYKEMKDTNEKRDILLVNITDLTRDLCGTILRMEATNHFDLVGRLKADIEIYTRLLAKAAGFIQHYETQGEIAHVAARNELGNKFAALNRELDSFGARFRTNRLVDLAINQSVNTRTLDKVHDMVLEEKLEKWLQSPPDMRRKQLATQKLRKDGTGLWLLESDKFLSWQDNPGSLWIRGPSGAGKSVLSSTVISKLLDDRQLLVNDETVPPPSALAFFYFDFNDKQGQAVESALRRIALQLSAQSPHQYRALETQYSFSNGQTLPTYQNLRMVLEELLLGLGRTYIVLDALDECTETDVEQLLDFISTLRSWTRTPLHLLMTSQPRSIFTETLVDVPSILLESDVTEKDIEFFISGELLKPRLKIWTSSADYITGRIVHKSNGMFRLAACLLVELARCSWEDELEETLENLPSHLFGIYDRFLEATRPKDFIYVEGVLRWLIFSARPVTLDELADAVAFDFSDPTRYIYIPSRREGNTGAILRWLEGLVVVNQSSELILAHASVHDYVLSKPFSHKFSRDLSGPSSHTFIALTCMGYLMHFSNHSLDDGTLPTYPLAEYVAEYWCHHLLRCHDRDILFDGAMQLLEDPSTQYEALLRLHRELWLPYFPASPLHLCCHEGYIEGVRALVSNGADVNLQSTEGTPLDAASRKGYLDIVGLLLDNGADVNATRSDSGSALTTSSWHGHTDIVHLLLANGADVNTTSEKFGSVLQAASAEGHTDVVRLLVENGADVNITGGKFGSALQTASRNGTIAIVRILLESGADVNATAGKFGSALQTACRNGTIDIVRLLIKNGVNVNATSETFGSALQTASRNGMIHIVRLFLENSADVNATGGPFGSALEAAAMNGHTSIARLLLENGADGSALVAASRDGRADIVGLLLESGADVNATGRMFGRALQTASWWGHTKIVELLLENGADVSTYGSALQAAYSEGNTEIADLLLEKGAIDARDMVVELERESDTNSGDFMFL